MFDLPNIRNYVENFDLIVDILSEYYSIPNTPLDKDDIKWLFDMIVYGGSFIGWKIKLNEGSASKGYSGKNIQNKSLHPLVSDFQKECTAMSDRVYKDNAGLVKKVNNYDVKLKSMNETAEKKMKEDIKNGVLVLNTVARCHLSYTRRVFYCIRSAHLQRLTVSGRLIHRPTQHRCSPIFCLVCWGT